jgi:GNAT superfamily N-acetyltransferase
MSLLYIACLPRRAARLWGKPTSAGGSRNQKLYIRDGIVSGFSTSRTEAFESIAVEFLGEHYYPFFGFDESKVGVEEEAEELIGERWDNLGVGPKDQVFVLDLFQLPFARRGHGEGRSIYAQLEAKLKAAGVKAIILQAGNIDPITGHSIGFWRKMGFEEWPGDYWMFDDKIMVKVIR